MMLQGSNLGLQLSLLLEQVCQSSRLPFMRRQWATMLFGQLQAEYRTRGVRVVALCPGPTATNFFTVLEAPEMPVMGRMRTPEAVVMAGLRALEQGGRMPSRVAEMPLEHS